MAQSRRSRRSVNRRSKILLSWRSPSFALPLRNSDVPVAVRSRVREYRSIWISVIPCRISGTLSAAPYHATTPRPPKNPLFVSNRCNNRHRQCKRARRVLRYVETTPKLLSRAPLVAEHQNSKMVVLVTCTHIRIKQKCEQRKDHAVSGACYKDVEPYD